MRSRQVLRFKSRPATRNTLGMPSFLRAFSRLESYVHGRGVSAFHAEAGSVWVITASALTVTG